MLNSVSGHTQTNQPVKYGFLPTPIYKHLFFVLMGYALYIYTCSPSIGSGDPAILINNTMNLYINTEANTHNLTILMDWLFSKLTFLELAYRFNLMDSIAGGTTIALFYLTLLNHFKSMRIAGISTLFLMISHSMWWNSTIAEVYAINGVFTVIALHLYCRLHDTKQLKYLYWIFFSGGLAIFNHAQMGFIMVGASFCLLCLFFSSAVKPFLKTALKCSLAFLIGFLPYFITFLKDVMIVKSYSAVIKSALGGSGQSLFFKNYSFHGFQNFCVLVFMQCPSFYLPVVLLGIGAFILKWRLSKAALGLGVGFVLNTFFFMFYPTWDVFQFLLPSFIILAFFGAFGLERILEFLSKRKSFALTSLSIILLAFSFLFTIYFYHALPVWGNDPDSVWYKRYNNSFSANLYPLNGYIANPDKRNFHAFEKGCLAVLNHLPENSIFFDADSRLYYQLSFYYQKYLMKRMDLKFKLVNSFGFSNWGNTLEDFVRILNDAYDNNKDLFFISLGHPFSRYFKELGKKNKYQFVKYPLGEKQWVYKLVTKNQDSGNGDVPQSTPLSFALSKEQKILLSLGNVLYSKMGNVFIQDNMADVGPYWESGKQVFFSPMEIGAELAFLVKTSEEFTGRLKIGLTLSYDFAVVDIFLNGNKLTKNPIDLYSKNPAYRFFEFERIPFRKDNNTLSFKILGKNWRSAGMKMGVDIIEISTSN